MTNMKTDFIVSDELQTYVICVFLELLFVCFLFHADTFKNQCIGLKCKMILVIMIINYQKTILGPVTTSGLDLHMLFSQVDQADV